MAALQIHHRVPRCVLRLCEKAEAHTEMDGEGLQKWMDYELEAMRFGVDPDTPRDELAAMVEGSTVEIPADDHRDGHAEDFARWGRRGGLATVRRYGTAWFSLLAKRRWERITADELAATFAAIAGRL